MQLDPVVFEGALLEGVGLGVGVGSGSVIVTLALRLAETFPAASFVHAYKVFVPAAEKQ